MINLHMFQLSDSSFVILPKYQSTGLVKNLELNLITL